MSAKNHPNKEENAKQTCFVIMPFSDPEGYEPGHFRKIYDHTFAPAIRNAGYEPLRIDDNSVSNLIHGKMMNELVSAPMVLCDLSSNNPNVLYELGIRHAFDKPVVLVQDNGQNRIFDVGGITSVEYHRSRLYEDVIEDQKKITRAIIETANAKNKYSIMSLVAIPSAKPANSDSVTHEDRLENMLLDISRKVNSLERKSAPLKQTDADDRSFDERNSLRSHAYLSLKEVIDRVESDIAYSEFSGNTLSEEEILKYQFEIMSRIATCRAIGISNSDIDPAYRLIERLRDLLKNSNNT